MRDAISQMLTVLQVACQQDFQEDKQKQHKASPGHHISIITTGHAIGLLYAKATISTRSYCSLSGF